MKPFPGVGIFSMPAAEYFDIDAASNSGLKHISKTPAHFMEARLNPIEPTPAMLLGTAVHAAVLEPPEFERAFVVLPEDRPKRPSSVQRNAKKPSAETLYAIDWWDSFNIQHGGKSILEIEDHAAIVAMRSAVMSHRSAAEILSSGIPEQAVFWIDEDTGVPCKARIDWLDRGTPADLKTTDDAGVDAFSRTVEKYRYHCQAAFYMDGLAANGIDAPMFPFIVVEKTPPYGVAVYTLDAEAIELGRRIYKRDLATYAWCVQMNSWPCYSPDIQEIKLPRWAFSKEREE